MQEFIPGQRWISDAELNMGLGTILSVEHRTLTIHFPVTGETRTYAKQSAPLTRVVFAPGDSITDFEGSKLTIESVIEQDGLLSYCGLDEQGEPAELDESGLDNAIQLYKPSERLFTGQVDSAKWFELRYLSLFHSNRLAHSELTGLTGSRTSLISHQLYIAHEVAKRFAPRVLLADEVGLGKTIEAGLILNQQLLSEQAQRVLILVPETLVHQWLVEMIRRFNLMFSVFDESRCQAIEDSAFSEASEHGNPFQTEQLIICSLDFLQQDRHRQQQALDGNWDLLVVDEAHHLTWSAEKASEQYTLVESLAAVTQGVLLLTATPEQLGKHSHFARLRLLDPDRFSDYQQFLEEEKSYQPIAHAMENLISEQTLDKTTLALIKQTLGEGDNQQLLNTLADEQADGNEQSAAREQLIEHLLDRHGTGRILFRNTRDAIKGFPERQLHHYPMPLPEAYQQSELPLYPDIEFTENQPQSSWTDFDPRYHWLVDKLKQLWPQKILVIAAHAETALTISQQLKLYDGIQASVFHEQMSIVERDRAAAFFAEKDDGCQVLVCSEIGSEGRNFQFAHHLVLFDLPLNPDLLEQRIGRLDRIGQSETIQLHVPYFEHTAQQVLFNWYHEGLNAFEHTCPEGSTIYDQLAPQLQEVLNQAATDNAAYKELLSQTQQRYKDLHQSLQQGRDRLLEYNSCRPKQAQRLQQLAQQDDEQSSIDEYMDYVYDCLGFDFEELSLNRYHIRPGEHMISSFPGLPDDGLTITYDRNTALENEDIHFLSWEHPLIINAMDMVQTSELGNTALTAVNYKGLKPGSLLLECLYLMESASSKQLQSNRYLPTTMIRVLIDEQGRDHHQALPHASINQHQTLVDSSTSNKIIKAKQRELRKLITTSEQLAYTNAPRIMAEAHARSQQALQTEINRLKALQSVNPNVRDEEIQYFELQLRQLTQVLENASLRLDAMRVIVTT